MKTNVKLAEFIYVHLHFLDDKMSLSIVNGRVHVTTNALVKRGRGRHHQKSVPLMVYGADKRVPIFLRKKGNVSKRHLLSR
jgi:hypothetical protein